MVTSTPRSRAQFEVASLPNPELRRTPQNPDRCPRTLLSPGFGAGEHLRGCCSSGARPLVSSLAQSGLQLPPPKWLFLFSWNFLLALIFILYLFSSAENWHLMCPVRLCGSSLIDLVASPWPQLCQRAQPWARPFPVPSLFSALPRVSQRSRGGPGCPESRRSPSQAPTQEIWLPAALHPPFLARAFPSWSAGCSKPCTSRHPTFDEAWAGPRCSSGSFPKHCRSDQNLSCCLQP